MKEGKGDSGEGGGKGGGGIFPSLLLSRFGGRAAKATLCDDETKSAAMRRRETKERRDSLRDVCGAFFSLACACGLRRGVGLGTLCAACVVAAASGVVLCFVMARRRRGKGRQCDRAVMFRGCFSFPLSSSEGGGLHFERNNAVKEDQQRASLSLPSHSLIHILITLEGGDLDSSD